MRTAFIQQLIEEARRDEKVFLLTGDLGFSVLEPFAQAFPDRYINVGVAEQNMTGIAAGLAMDGWTVFTYSIANFPTLRCIEQIRYDICYHNLNVKIVSVGAGFAYGPLGASHHATEDIAMMRAIPNITVASPGDPIETKQITSAFVKHHGPCYLRLGKAGEPKVHEEELRVEFGKGIEVKKGNGTAVITTGAMLKYATDLIEEKQNLYGLYSFPFIKPIDKNVLVEISNIYHQIIVMEEHQLSGGFGSAVLEAYNDLIEIGAIHKFPKIRRIGIADQFISISGSQEFLRNTAGLKLEL
jgi:transketolase